MPDAAPYCHYCGPGYRYGDEGCRHMPPDGSADLNQLVLDTQRERDQLRYERRLLGYARLVLDRAAEYDNLNPVDREGLPAEAADIAQRIVDEIGHPVTDEPALGPSYREQIAALIAERDQARRDAASWEDWGRGWKVQYEASQVERDKAWAELDRLRAGQAATPDGPRTWALPDGFKVRYGVELAHGPGWTRGYAVVDNYADLAEAQSMAAHLGGNPDRPTRVTRRAVGPYFPLADATPAADEAWSAL